jgi:hypothetical protein
MKKNPLNIISPLLISILFGLICNFIWLYEIIKIKGWYGLNWLEGYMNSVFLIIPLTISSYLISIKLFKKIEIKNMIIAFIGLSVISLVSYEISRQYLYMTNPRFFGFFDFDKMLTLIISRGTIVPLVLYLIGFYYLTNRFLIKIPKWTIFLFLKTIILSIVFGIITIKMHTGYGYESNFIDSVKMGYPIFWLNLFLGINVIELMKQIKN